MRFRISQRAVVQAWTGSVVVLFAIIAVAAIASTHAHGSVVNRLQPPATTSRRAGPAPIVAGLSVASYRVQLVVTPNRASARNRVAIAISSGDRPVTDARVTVTYSMPAMNMDNVFTGPLRQDAYGRYGAVEPVLGMPGTWALRFEVAPRHARPFTVLVDDHMLR